MRSDLPNLQFAAYRFLLKAIDPVHLPPNAGSTLRGAFGSTFKRVACFQRNRPPDNCDGCSVSHNCPYGYVFETKLPPDSEVLRSQRDVPHPFVLEPPQDPPPVYEPGSAIEFRTILMGRGIAYLPYFVESFSRLGATGIGRGRGRYQLEEVRAEHPAMGRSEPIYRDGNVLPCSVDLSVTGSDLVEWCRSYAPSRLSVRFETPTRLVSDGKLVGEPAFPLLVRSALRRLSSLAYFHGGHQWDMDFRGMVEEAGRVELSSSDTRWVSWERYSSRQDARMNLGGVMGTAVYEGPVASFLPLILASGISHVGKACTFGNGKLRVWW